MKIADPKICTINLPLTPPFQSASALRTATTRTGVLLTKDDSLIRSGETFRAPPTAGVNRRSGYNMS